MIRDRGYCPDTWVILGIVQDDQSTLYKILAGWYGGFMAGDSWKLSSGIESIQEFEEYYLMPNSSGSVYKCYKNSYRMSGYTQGIYLNFKNQLGDSIVLVDEKDVLTLKFE